MPLEGRHAKSKKRIIVKTPGNKRKIHYKKSSTRPHICSICGKKLRGKASKNIGELKKSSKTEKTISRIYGANICHQCISNLLQNSVRRG